MFIEKTENRRSRRVVSGSIIRFYNIFSQLLKVELGDIGVTFDDPSDTSAQYRV